MEQDTVSLHEKDTRSIEDNDCQNSTLLTNVLKRNSEVMENLLKVMTQKEEDRVVKKKRNRSSSPSSTGSSSSSSSSPHRLPRRKKRKTGSSKTKGIKPNNDPIESQGPPSSGEEFIEETLEIPSDTALDLDADINGEGNKSSDEEDWYKEANAELEVDKEIGEPLSDLLATFTNKRFSEPPKDENIKEKFSKYKRPENCHTLNVRQTNKEIWNLLKGFNKKTDMKWTSVQKSIAKITTAISRASDIITDMAKSKKTGRAKEAVKGLTDAISILGHTQQKITNYRREAQRPALPFDVRGICEMPADGHEWLYGNDVKKLIREAKEQRRLITPSSHNFSSYRQSQSYTRKKGHFLGRRGGQTMNTGQRRGGKVTHSSSGQGNWNRRPVMRK